MEKSNRIKKRRLSRIVFISFATLFVLFSVLVIHIYMVTKPVKYDNNNLQLSRIDFKEEISVDESAKIKHFVMGLPGIQNVVFNLKDRTLVFGYTLGEQNSLSVYDQLINFGHYKAERCVVNEAQLNSGCPIGKDKSSFTYKLSAYISTWF